MTTSRIYAYRWPARLVSHKPFAAERYSITSSCIWQVFFRKNADFLFYLLCFVNSRIFCARCTISALFAGGKLPRSPLQHQYGRERQGLYLLYRRTPSRENRLPERPRTLRQSEIIKFSSAEDAQIFSIGKFKIILPLKMRRAARRAVQIISSSAVPPTPRAG